MIRYLTVDEVIDINERMILMYNDNEQIGVKDKGLLESAVYKPQQTLFEDDAYKTIYDKAAVLLYSIAKNHAFFNANKRTALMSMVMFLYMNDLKFTMSDSGSDEFLVRVVKDEFTLETIASIIKSHTV
ncbi:type II toxin-antitoxin system death-on-curing family toxin [Priestia aryabhattai]|uniref:type II toxin-antitoxin system death-on-curing family toxin n=1 Tax=Priestia aryabhattai TaxID=412384 RepID=UPI0015F57EFB|nr:type II toxin-antitoxin system death-on-curing family toxin [Priestia aryabhattai]